MNFFLGGRRKCFLRREKLENLEKNIETQPPIFPFLAHCARDNEVTSIVQIREEGRNKFFFSFLIDKKWHPPCIHSWSNGTLAATAAAQFLMLIHVKACGNSNLSITKLFCE